MQCWCIPARVQQARNSAGSWHGSHDIGGGSRPLLLRNSRDAVAIQPRLFAAYPRVHNDPELFGYQLVCTEHDEFVGHFPFLLSMASLLSLGQLQDLVGQFGGAAVPSHVERRNGLLYQLGVVTPGMQFPTYEVARPADAAAVARQLPEEAQIISNSDSHALDMIGPPHCVLELESISVAEVLLALRHEGGRRTRLL